LLSQIDKKLIEASDDVKNESSDDKLLMPKNNNKKLLHRPYKLNEFVFEDRMLNEKCKLKEYNNEKSNSFKLFNDKYKKVGE
jgi:hypothetical protein